MLIMPTIMERACEFDGGSAVRGVVIIFIIFKNSFI